MRARRTHALGAGEDVEILDGQRDVLTIRRGPLTVVLNCGAAPVSLPAGERLIASGELEGGKLPADTAVWLRDPS